MPEIMEIVRARITAQKYCRQAENQRPRNSDMARQSSSEGAAVLQKCFEGLPVKLYADGRVKTLVQDIIDWRQKNTEEHLRAGDSRHAGFELRQLAHLRELTVIKPFNAEILTLAPADSNYYQLVEAVGTRKTAIELFRRSESVIEMAFELSYLSRVIMFLRRNYLSFQTDQVREELIGQRGEAAPLFESFRQFKDAFHEYRQLAELEMEKARLDPLYYQQVADAALLGISMIEQGKLSEIDREITLCNLGRKAFRVLREKAAGDSEQYARYSRIIAELQTKAYTLRQRWARS
jgi:hypothetical protein